MSLGSPEPTCRRVLSGAGALTAADQTERAATVGPSLLARPGKRLGLGVDASYAHARAAVLEFLYARHAAPAIAA